MKPIQRNNNFFQEAPGNNSVYKFNQSHPDRQDVRDYCSKLLEHHWQYCADIHFQQDAVENPQQRWWEMYLSWVLFKIGKLKGLSVHGEGPDFCAELHDGRKLWIEAIAVKPGTGENEVTRPPVGRAGSVPTDKIILRFTSAFSEKVKKIRKYRTQKIIAPDDAVIVAINSGEMRDSDLADIDPPLAARALLGVGDATFKISVNLENPSLNTEKVEMFFPEQISVKKNAMTSISTQSLLNSPEISGVFTSTRHLVDLVESGNDIKILLNPKAQNPLSKNLFKFGRFININ